MIYLIAISIKNLFLKIELLKKAKIFIEISHNKFQLNKIDLKKEKNSKT